MASSSTKASLHALATASPSASSAHASYTAPAELSSSSSSRNSQLELLLGNQHTICAAKQTNSSSRRRHTSWLDQEQHGTNRWTGQLCGLGPLYQRTTSRSSRGCRLDPTADCCLDCSYRLAPRHGCCWFKDTSALAEPLPTFVCIHPVSWVYRHTSDGDGHV